MYATRAMRSLLVWRPRPATVANCGSSGELLAPLSKPKKRQDDHDDDHQADDVNDAVHVIFLRYGLSDRIA